MRLMCIWWHVKTHFPTGLLNIFVSDVKTQLPMAISICNNSFILENTYHAFISQSLILDLLKTSIWITNGHTYKQIYLKSKLQGFSTVLLPSMNHKLPVIKCVKLSAVFIAERKVKIKVGRKGMMEKN